MATNDTRTTRYTAVQKASTAVGAVFLLVGIHNIVHLIFGVAGLLMARAVRSARGYLIGGAVIYAVLWLYGLVIDRDSQANFVPVNTADNWLHFVLAVGMIALGVLLSRRVVAATPETAVPHTTR